MQKKPFRHGILVIVEPNVPLLHVNCQLGKMSEPCWKNLKKDSKDRPMIL